MWPKLRLNSIRIFFYLFLVSIPFGTRILLYQFTNGFHEYEGVFLYASDILMILFIVSSLRITDNLQIYRFPYPYICTKFVFCSLLIFLSVSALSIFFAFSKGLAIYNFARLVLLVLLAVAMAKILKEGIVKLENILAVIAGSAVFQSLIGIAQFFKQSSLGLGVFGEPILGEDIGGAAKIVVDGAKILRAYGTFPHPNVLAAFLILGLVSLYYFFLVENGHSEPRFAMVKNLLRSFTSLGMTSLAVGTFIILLGIVLAFSRTAWVIAILITIAAVFYHRNWRLALLMAAIFGILIFGFSNYVFPRAQIAVKEPSVSYRLEYNKLALDLIRKNPFGVGIGNQVLYSVKNEIYQKFGMDQPWQWQPIHNIYLLIASETGIFGLVAFLIFLLGLLIPNFKFLISKQIPITNYQLLITAIMLSALLLFGFFDHFLWSLQPGRLMFWLIIGILLASSPRSIMDNTQASEA